MSPEIKIVEKNFLVQIQIFLLNEKVDNFNLLDTSRLLVGHVLSPEHWLGTTALERSKNNSFIVSP